MERRRRKFLATDLGTLLIQEGLHLIDLLPGGSYSWDTRLALGQSDLTPSFLPLELFDDTDFDARTPADWLALGVEGGSMTGVPASVLLVQQTTTPPTLAWHSAVVTAYDNTRQLFSLTIDGGSQVTAPRIFVLFTSEDPAIFAQRLTAAWALRQQTEGLLRYQLAIDCMPLEGAAPSVADVARILSRANGRHAQFSKFVTIRKLVQTDRPPPITPIPV